MNFTQQDLIYYTIIVGCCLYLLNPTNLKYKHVHITTSLLLSYFIIFPSKFPVIRRYLYNLRGLLLIYFVLAFKTDPTISLLLFINYLMLVYKEDYEKTKTKQLEGFQNEYAEKVSKGVDNFSYGEYKHDNVKDSEYKHDNVKDNANGRKYISDKQLDIISNNQIGHNLKEISTYRDGYSAQGTTFTMGYNYGDYGEN